MTTRDCFFYSQEMISIPSAQVIPGIHPQISKELEIKFSWLAKEQRDEEESHSISSIHHEGRGSSPLLQHLSVYMAKQEWQKQMRWISAAF